MRRGDIIISLTTRTRSGVRTGSYPMKMAGLIHKAFASQMSNRYPVLPCEGEWAWSHDGKVWTETHKDVRISREYLNKTALSATRSDQKTSKMSQSVSLGSYPLPKRTNKLKTIKPKKRSRIPVRVWLCSC
eukprot:5155798-Amphidinium_carterae.1